MTDAPSFIIFIKPLADFFTAHSTSQSNCLLLLASAPAPATGCVLVFKGRSLQLCCHL